VDRFETADEHFAAVHDPGGPAWNPGHDCPSTSFPTISARNRNSPPALACAALSPTSVIPRHVANAILRTILFVLCPLVVITLSVFMCPISR
jgi:hypothetical protein